MRTISPALVVALSAFVATADVHLKGALVLLAMMLLLVVVLRATAKGDASRYECRKPTRKHTKRRAQ